MNRANLKLFIRSSAVSMIGVGALGIMNYLIRRILRLNLSDVDFGFFYSAFALIMIALVFLDLGLGQSATIMISKSLSDNNLQKAKKVFTLTFSVRMLLAFITLGALDILAPYLTKYYFKYPGSFILLTALFFMIPVQTLEACLLCLIHARKAFSTQSILINVKTFIILTGIFFTVKIYGIESCILWFITGGVIISAVTFLIVRNYGIGLVPLKELSPHDFRSIFSLSYWIAVSTAGIMIMYQLDTICLTWLRGLESVAMYQTALPVMQIAQSFFVFPFVFIPFVAEMWQKKDYSGIRRTCLIGSLLMFMTLPVFILAGIYFASDIITILFDRKYIAAAPAVTILWSGMVFFSIAKFNISALNSGGRQKNPAFLVIVCVAVNFLLNVILIPQYNYIGAALATAITYVIMAAGAIVSLIFVFSSKKNF